MVRNEKLLALAQLMEQLGIKEKDLKESFVKGSGKGGQKVNKTNNCVVLQHLPTETVIKCHQDRSREINRFLARRALCELIQQHNGDEANPAQKRIAKVRQLKSRRLRAQKRKATKSTNTQLSNNETHRPEQDSLK